jgi:crotonobetainyl-CoA:carnitine CoA-transferase CaiB-like acyl-CoA transferase
MGDSLLTGFKALDLTNETGIICGKILANMGVDVIKVEKPDGDSARDVPPFCRDNPEPNNGLYWLAFNTDKRGITLNLETAQGQDLFKKLVKSADFVIESFPPGYLDKLGLGYTDLAEINPRVIMTSITPFGQKGPYSHYKSCELVAAAMSGILENTGDPDRAPVKEAPYSIYFQANGAAALGTILSHYHREMTGEGQQVDVSIHECAASRNINGVLFWLFDKRLVKRSGAINILGQMKSRWIWQCKDGYLYWFLMGGMIGAGSYRALSKWMDDDGVENPFKHVTDWGEFDRAALTEEMNDAYEKAIGNFFLRRTKKEIAEEGLKRGINATILNDPADVFASDHLRARNYWTELDYPESGQTIEHPRHFFLCSETENYTSKRAPLIGEDNDKIYREELGLSAREITDLKKAGVI